MTTWAAADSSRRQRFVAVALVVVLIVATIVAIATDAVEASAVERWVEGLGWWGPVGFVLLMWIVQPLGVPGAMFMVPASVLWSLPLAIVLSWIGNMGSSAIAFSFARWVGREWVRERIPTRLERFDARLKRGGFVDVLLLRVLTGQLPPADWLLGVSSVAFRPFVLGTALGIIPGIVLVVVGGGGLIRALS